MERKYESILSRRALRTLPNNQNTITNRDGPEKRKVAELQIPEQSQKIPKPAQKTSLIRKLSQRYNRADSFQSQYENETIKNEYREFIAGLIDREKGFLLQRNFLQKRFTIMSRSRVINWLLQVQQHFKLSESIYYLAVKIMDLTSAKYPHIKDDKLLAMTSLWIVYKFENPKLPKPLLISDMILLMNNKYNKKDILQMEKQILQAINYQIFMPEPSDFIEFFLLESNLYDKKLVYHGSYFVCDCISMFPNFACVQPSLIAAIAVYTSVKILNENSSQLDMILKSTHLPTLKINCQECISKIREINKTQGCREPFLKYSVLSRFNVAKHFDSLG